MLHVRPSQAGPRVPCGPAGMPGAAGGTGAGAGLIHAGIASNKPHDALSPQHAHVPHLKVRTGGLQGGALLETNKSGMDSK